MINVRESGRGSVSCERALAYRQADQRAGADTSRPGYYTTE